MFRTRGVALTDFPASPAKEPPKPFKWKEIVESVGATPIPRKEVPKPKLTRIDKLLSGPPQEMYDFFESASPDNILSMDEYMLLFARFRVAGITAHRIRSDISVSQKLALYFENASCSEFILYYLTGIDPLRLLDIRSKAGLTHGYDDKLMAKTLMSEGFFVVPLYDRIVQAKKGTVMTPLRPNHVVLKRCSCSEGQSSWFLDWGGLAVHNFSMGANTDLGNNLTVFSRFMLWHPDWLRELSPSEEAYLTALNEVARFETNLPVAARQSENVSVE